jgi:hypothetical protein
MQRYYQGTTFVEPTAKEPNHNNNRISPEDTEALMLAGLGSRDGELVGQLDFNCIQKGVDFKWDNPPLVSKSDITPGFIEPFEKTIVPCSTQLTCRYFELF